MPHPQKQWSLLCEVSESAQKPVDGGSVVDCVVSALKRARLIRKEEVIVSRWHRRIAYSYPTPFLGRDQMLNRIDTELRRLGIWSRGRFGGWKYEVANQDHSFMQGVEAIDHVLAGAEETTYHYPDRVNSGILKDKTSAPASSHRPKK